MDEAIKKKRKRIIIFNSSSVHVVLICRYSQGRHVQLRQMSKFKWLRLSVRCGAVSQKSGGRIYQLCYFVLAIVHNKAFNFLM